jgi:hypothetical protein
VRLGTLHRVDLDVRMRDTRIDLTGAVALAEQHGAVGET